MDTLTTDVLIIGGGVVGLAVANEWARRGFTAMVLEQEERACTHTSSRNSGVIHAGIYYQPHSLKAKLCVAGNRKLYDYAKRHHIPHHSIGKWIVAVNAGEEAELYGYQAKAKLNQVGELPFVSQQVRQELCPDLSLTAALYSPTTGIIDSVAYGGALENEGQAIGVIHGFQTRWLEAQLNDEGLFLHVVRDQSSQSEFRIISRYTINAGGLWAVSVADKLPRADHAPPLPEARFARGHYFALKPKPPAPLLIYPLAQAHSLGIHLTLDLDGTGRFGPDVEWLKSAGDVILSHPPYSIEEARVDGFVREIKRYWPGLTADKLTPAYAGIRPKIFQHGQPIQDFLIESFDQHGINGLVNLMGIESPGLTASLALADYVVNLALDYQPNTIL